MKSKNAIAVCAAAGPTGFYANSAFAGFVSGNMFIKAIYQESKRLAGRKETK